MLSNLGIIGTSSAQKRPRNEDLCALECEVWCVAHGLGLADCITPALFETGLCYECGPCKKNPSEEICDSRCVDTASDPSNCGGCGHQVSHNKA